MSRFCSEAAQASTELHVHAEYLLFTSSLSRRDGSSQLHMIYVLEQNQEAQQSCPGDTPGFLQFAPCACSLCVAFQTQVLQLSKFFSVFRLLRMRMDAIRGVDEWFLSPLSWPGAMSAAFQRRSRLTRAALPGCSSSAHLQFFERCDVASCPCRAIAHTILRLYDTTNRLCMSSCQPRSCFRQRSWPVSTSVSEHMGCR